MAEKCPKNLDEIASLKTSNKKNLGWNCHIVDENQIIDM